MFICRTKRLNKLFDTNTICENYEKGKENSKGSGSMELRLVGPLNSYFFVVLAVLSYNRFFLVNFKDLLLFS